MNQRVEDAGWVAKHRGKEGMEDAYPCLHVNQQYAHSLGCSLLKTHQRE